MVKRKGFTLIEVVMAMTILAIVVYSLLSVFVTAGVKGADVEIFTVAQSLAEGKLEQVIAKDFDAIASEAQTNYSGELSGYTYQVQVNYVSFEALDTNVGSPTEHKKVIVLIQHPNLPAATQLKTIKADY